MSTLFDVAAWAARTGAGRDAIYELHKVPARLGMHDDDLGLIPACLKHFEAVVAPSGYAVVSKSADLEAARRRGNARVRALLQRYLASVAPAAQPAGSARALWEPLIDYVAGREGFPADSAPWTSGASRSLTILRARASCGPAALTEAEVNRINRQLDGAKRKSLRKAIARLNALIAVAHEHPAIAGMLPASPLAKPAPADRARRIVWATLPEAFRRSVDLLLERATETPEMQAREARQRIAAGEDRATVLAEFEAQRTREMGNRRAARAGYRSAITWLLRAQIERGLDPATLADARAVFTPAAVEQAIADQVARSRGSLRLKDPEKSQTLHNRLTAVRTLARYGLRDAALAEDIALIATERAPFVRRPGKDGMTEEARLFCRQLIQAPHVAALLVNAPARIASIAEGKLATARAAGSEARELSALRLHAAAVLFAMQMSRPVRTGNLIRARVSAAGGVLNRLTWVTQGRQAEITFPVGEVKNGRTIKVSLYDGDAAILWRWVSDLRPRYMQLRGIADSAYLLPGDARPRHLKDGVELPRGCVAPSTLAEIWEEGARCLGLDLTPHMARHAVATLILALQPGNYALAASVLGDTEETVRKHYGHEDGARAAAEVRKTLLASHPDLFRALTRRSEQ
jgi:integrase